MTTFYLETYGCSLNTADSDLAVGRLTALGHKQTNLEEAAILIVNTCGVKEPTEDRIVHRLRQLSKLDLPLIIIGCLPKISYDRVIDAAPQYAAILGPQSIESLGHIFDRVVSGERGIIHLESDNGSKLRFYQGPPDTTICTIPICEGCLGACAYCAVRFARGAVRSHSINEIVEVVTRSIHLGYHEIRLTSQDAGVFGADTGENLVDLLAALDKLPGEHRFRLGMFNPNLVLDSIDEIAEIMSSTHFFRFFHVPLQTGSDSLLQAMNRRYTLADWKDIVSRIRSRMPDATIATDIIVGFPGESDSDFEQTLDVITEIRPEVVNISKYGDRPNTAASKSKHKVDTQIKKNRSRKLSRLVETLSHQSNKSWIGWTGFVLVTEPAPRGGTLTRTQSYKPIILKEPLSPGSYVNIEVISSEQTHLLGEIITAS